MLSFNSTQQAIAASSYKKPTWLFEITLDGNSTPDYYWSTKNVTYGSQAYTFKIPPKEFTGVRLSRAKTEFGLQAPNTCEFLVPNKNDALTASDFDDCMVHIKLAVSDGTNEEILCQWKMTPETTPKSRQQSLRFKCIDYVFRYLNKSFPTTPLISDLFPLSSKQYGNPNDNMCVPVVFGTGYIPVRPIYTDSDRFYLLGPAGPTYTVNQVRSPRGYAANPSYWDSGDYSFTQSTKTGADGNNYRMVQPIIADADADGDEDSVGVWANGNVLYDMPCKYFRSDLSGYTCFSDIIKYILLALGMPSAMIGTSSFSSAKTTFSGWGLTADLAGYYYKRPAREVLAELLTQCHSTLAFTDTVNLVVLDSTSRATIDTSVVLKEAFGETSFNYSYTVQVAYDSGYVAMPEAGEPIDQLFKALVPCKVATDEIAADIVNCLFIPDTQDAQRAGILHFQRRFGRSGSADFKTKGKLLALQPDDVITIDDDKYGGTYYALIDTMSIGRDLVITFGVGRYKYALDNWTDLSPSSITLADDESTIVWSTATIGPDGTVSSGSVANLLTGRLKIGQGATYILFDPEPTSATYGMVGADSLLGTVFYLPLDGSPPEFSSGIIKEAEYQIYTSGVIKTDTAPATNGGMLMNNNGLKGYTNAGDLFFELDLTLETVAIGDQTGIFTELDGSAMTIYDATTALAVFGSTIRVGPIGSGLGNLYIDGSGNLYIRNNTDELITLSSTGTAKFGRSGSGLGNVYIDSSGNMSFRVNETEYISIASTGVASIQLIAGSDLSLKGTTGDSAKADFYINSTTKVGSIYASYTSSYFYMQGANSSKLSIKDFDTISIYSDGAMTLRAGNASASTISFVTYGGTMAILDGATNDSFYSPLNYNLGHSGAYWNILYVERVYASSYGAFGGPYNTSARFKIWGQGTGSLYTIDCVDSGGNALMYVLDNGYTWAYQAWATSDERRKRKLAVITEPVKARMRSIKVQTCEMDRIPGRTVATISAQQWLKAGFPYVVDSAPHAGRGKEEYCTNSGSETAMLLKYIQELHDDIEYLKAA